jgi:hypothetical protein
MILGEMNARITLRSVRNILVLVNKKTLSNNEDDKLAEELIERK